MELRVSVATETEMVMVTESEQKIMPRGCGLRIPPYRTRQRYGMKGFIREFLRFSGRPPGITKTSACDSSFVGHEMSMLVSGGLEYR